MLSRLEDEQNGLIKENKLVNQKSWVEKHMGTNNVSQGNRSSNFIIYGSITLYIIVMSVFFMMFSCSRDFRYSIFEFIESLKNEGLFSILTVFIKGEIKGPLILAIYEFCSIMLGFDIFVYDILIGFILRPYLYALTFVFCVKMIAKYLMFILARYCFRDYIYSMMRDNIYFITCYIAIYRKPIKITILLQFLTLPTIFKTYGVGLFRVTHLQYISITAISNLIWSIIWVYVGYSIVNIIDYLESGSTSSVVPWWFQILMFLLSLLVIIYLCNLTQKIYNHIQEQASEGLEELSI